jgi:hypothetical protein
VFAATSADVDAVVIDGQQVVCGGEHVTVPSVAAELTAAIAELFR